MEQLSYLRVRRAHERVMGHIPSGVSYQGAYERLVRYYGGVDIAKDKILAESNDPAAEFEVTPDEEGKVNFDPESAHRA